MCHLLYTATGDVVQVIYRKHKSNDNVFKEFPRGNTVHHHGFKVNIFVPSCGVDVGSISFDKSKMRSQITLVVIAVNCECRKPDS